MSLFVHKATRPDPPPPRLYARAILQLSKWADYGRLNISTSLRESRWLFAEIHLAETIGSAESDYPGARRAAETYMAWNEQRWKPKISGWQVAGVLSLAACPFGFLACAGAATTLGTTETLVAFSDNFAAPGPFDTGKFAKDALFNFGTAVAGLVPFLKLGTVWSLGCASSETCSSNEWDGSVF